MNTTTNDCPQMLTLRQASDLSGLSYHTLRRLCQEGRIVHFRTGSKFLINYPKLICFLNGGAGHDSPIN